MPIYELILSIVYVILAPVFDRRSDPPERKSSGLSGAIGGGSGDTFLLRTRVWMPGWPR